MSGSVKYLIRPLLSGVLGLAKSTLQDRNKLKNLVSTASLKMSTAQAGITSVKNDLTTLLDLVRAWIRGEYREVPWSTVLLVTGALIYFVNPMDAVPDILPATGLLDDAGVIGFVLASVKHDIESFRKWQFSSVRTGSSTFQPE